MSAISTCTDGFSKTLTGTLAEGWIGSGDRSASFSSSFTNQQLAHGL